MVPSEHLKKLVFAIGMIGLLLRACADGQCFYVSPSGNDASAGTGWDCPLKTIQAGVDKARSHDVVVVAPGTYLLDKAILCDGSRSYVTLRSSTGNPRDVIVDGQGKCPCLEIWRTGGCRVEGMTFQNGFGADKGSGLCLVNIGSDPGEIANCVIRNCVTFSNALDGYGGGADLVGAVEMTGCLIEGCVVSNDCNWAKVRAGGGLSLRDGARARDCIVRNNLSFAGQGVGSNLTEYYHGTGGGVFLRGGGGLENCVISNNVAAGDANYRSGAGGGVYVADAEGAVISGCLIADNRSNSFGGGIAANCVGDSPTPLTIRGCTIIGNHVTGSYGNIGGAGIWAWGNVPVRIANCRIDDNVIERTTNGAGGGLMLSITDFALTDSTVCDNGSTTSGGAMAFGCGSLGAYWARGMVSNCVFRGNHSLNMPAFNLNYPDGILFADCLIAENKTTHEGCLAKIYNREAARRGVTFRNCFVTKNYAPGEGGDGTESKMKGFCVNVWNEYACPVSFEQCTMVDNHCGTLLSPLYGQDASQISVRGCALYDNWQTSYSEECGFSDVTKEGQEFGPRFDKTKVTFSAFDISGMSPADRNSCMNAERRNVCVSVEGARFAHPAHGDWRLRSNSPLVNAGGTAESWMGEGRECGALDLGSGVPIADDIGMCGVRISYEEALPRLAGGLPDIGCFEFSCRPGSSVDGIPYSWFDGAGLPRDPDAPAPFLEGYSLRDVYDLGMDPHVAEYREGVVTVSAMPYVGFYDGIPHLIGLSVTKPEGAGAVTVRYSYDEKGAYVPFEKFVQPRNATLNGPVPVYAKILVPGLKPAYAHATVEIRPRVVVMRAGSAEKKYDGTPLTQPLSTEDEDAERALVAERWRMDPAPEGSFGFADGEGFGADLAMTADSKITDVGTATNVIDENRVSYAEGTDSSNYVLVCQTGVLTVTAHEGVVEENLCPIRQPPKVSWVEHDWGYDIRNDVVTLTALPEKAFRYEFSTPWFPRYVAADEIVVSFDCCGDVYDPFVVIDTRPMERCGISPARYQERHFKPTSTWQKVSVRMAFPPTDAWGGYGLGISIGKGHGTLRLCNLHVEEAMPTDAAIGRALLVGGKPMVRQASLAELVE